MPQGELNKAETSFEELAKLPENNPFPVFQVYKSGEIILANGASRNLFQGQQLHGNKFFDICPGFNEAKWEEVLHEPKQFRHETEVGSSIFIFTFVRPQMGDYIYAYGNDVTAFRQAQHKLAEQASKLQEMARFPEMNPGPVFRMDVEGKILLANAAAREIFGEDIYGRSWPDIFPVMTARLWRDILNSTEVIPVEAHVGKCDYVFAHRRDMVSNLVFVYGSDITYQKKTERALLQAEKMATLGTLAAGVAHELNNPAAATKRAAEQLRNAFSKLEKAHLLLNASGLSQAETEKIKTIESLALTKSKQLSTIDPLTRSDREAETEDWLDDHNIPEPWELAHSLVNLDMNSKELDALAGTFKGDSLYAALSWTSSVYLVYTLLNEIGQGSGRISEIVGALKNYSYLGQAPVQNINLHEGLDNTLVILRNKIKQGINITREYGSDVPMIFAYGSELNQVWTNILDNAIDAMKGKGEIVIRTHREKDNAVVEIEDNGPGIPKEIQSRIFDPFFTTKEPGKGTGLGLATTYGIITEKHRGKISVESHPGMTKFTVKLPIEKLQTATDNN
jgi:signal transduction histidine kinase